MFHILNLPTFEYQSQGTTQDPRFATHHARICSSWTYFRPAAAAQSSSDNKTIIQAWEDLGRWVNKAGFVTQGFTRLKQLSSCNTRMHLPCLCRVQHSHRLSGVKTTSRTASRQAAAGPNTGRKVYSLHIYFSQRLYKILIKLWCGDGL